MDVDIIMVFPLITSYRTKMKVSLKLKIHKPSIRLLTIICE